MLSAMARRASLPVPCGSVCLENGHDYQAHHRCCDWWRGRISLLQVRRLPCGRVNDHKLPVGEHCFRRGLGQFGCRQFQVGPPWRGCLKTQSALLGGVSHKWGELPSSPADVLERGGRAWKHAPLIRANSSDFIQRCPNRHRGWPAVSSVSATPLPCRCMSALPYPRGSGRPAR